MGVGAAWGTRDEWKEWLHPRGYHGRFKEKGLLNSLAKAIEELGRIMDKFNPRTFQSQQQANQHLFNVSQKAHGKLDAGRFISDFDHANDALRAGQMDPSTKKFVDMMDASSIELDDDLIVSKVVGADAFGLDAQSMHNKDGGLESMAGRLIADRGYSMTNVGPEVPNKKPGQITMRIALPGRRNHETGTRVNLRPGQRDGGLTLSRDQELRITKVNPDGVGGYYVMAVATPKTPGQNPEPRGGVDLPSLTPAEREAKVQAYRKAPRPYLPKGEEGQTGSPEELRKAAQQATINPPAVQTTRHERSARLGTPEPSPTGPTNTGANGPAPRQEPIAHPGIGTAGGGATRQPTAPENVPEGAPAQPISLDFRRAARNANLEPPSNGPRRREWNQAYQQVANGKGDPGDVVRMLEKDIDVNRERMNNLVDSGTLDKADPHLARDIRSQEDLADLIRREHGLGPRPAPERPKPVKKAAAPKKEAPKLAQVVPIKREERAANLPTVPEHAPTPRKAGAAKPNLDDIHSQLEAQSADNVPNLDREQAGNLVKDLSRNELLDLAERYNIPGAKSKTKEDLRREIVDTSVGRRLDSIATRGFTGKSPFEPGRSAAEVEAAKKAVPEAPKGPTVEELTKPLTDDEIVAKAERLRRKRTPTSVDKITINRADRILADRKKENAGKVAEVQVPTRGGGTVTLKNKGPEGVPPEMQKIADDLRAGRIDAKEAEKRILAIQAQKAMAGINTRDMAPEVGREITEAEHRLDRGDDPKEVAGRLRRQAATLGTENDAQTSKIELDPDTLRARQKAGKAALREAANAAVAKKAAPAKKALEVKPVPTPAEVSDLNTATIADMKKIAADEGVDLKGKRLKADIRKAIEDKRSGKVPEAPPVKKAAAPAKKATKAVPGAPSETKLAIRQPAANAPIKAADRRKDFEQAFDHTGPQIPDSAAGRTIKEIRNEIATGGYSPNEGIRRLENDIAINKQDLAEMEGEIRAATDPAEKLRLQAQRATLARDIKHQEHASSFLQKYFKDAPDITVQEMDLTPEQQAAFEKLTPDNLRELADRNGLGKLEGNTKDELFTDFFRKFTKQQLEKKATKAAKKLPAPKAPEAPKPDVAESPYKRIDANALAEGLDLRTPEDKKMLNNVQDLLDGKSDRLGKNPTPRQIGQDLERFLNGPASPTMRAISEDHIGNEPQYTGESNDEYGNRIRQASFNAAKYRKQASEIQKLADRLKNTRRTRKENAPEVRTTEPKLAAPEKADIAKVAEATGIPAPQLEKKALAKKVAEAPPKANAQQVAETIKSVSSGNEIHAILNKRTKSDIQEVGKALGMDIPTSKTKVEMINMISNRHNPRVTKWRRGELESMEPSELRQVEDDLGITKRPSLAKDDRIDAILQAQGDAGGLARGETPLRTPPEPTTRSKAVIPEAQTKIADAERKRGIEAVGNDLRELTGSGASKQALTKSLDNRLKVYEQEMGNKQVREDVQPVLDAVAAGDNDRALRLMSEIDNVHGIKKPAKATTPTPAPAKRVARAKPTGSLTAGRIKEGDVVSLKAPYKYWRDPQKVTKVERITVPRQGGKSSAGGIRITRADGQSRDFTSHHAFHEYGGETPEAPTDTRVRTAYDDLKQRPGDWVPLSSLREKMGGSREEQDKVLKEMATKPGVHIIPWDNRKGLTERDHEAALKLGGQESHAIRIEHAGEFTNVEKSLRDLLEAKQGRKGRIPLTEIRDELSKKYSQEEVDQILRKLEREGDISLESQENQQRLTEEDRASAIKVGNRLYHFLILNRRG